MKIIATLFIIAVSLFSQSLTRFVADLDRLPLAQRGKVTEQYIAKIQRSPIIENDSLFHVIYFGSASTVLVNGNIQRWNAPDTLRKIDCGENSFFWRSYVIPPDSRLDYQLIVDGAYQLDPLNPGITPSGFGPHSEIRMPKFVPSPYLIERESVPKGTIDSIFLYRYLKPPLSRYALGKRKIKIYLPPGYDSLQNLSSVYVHDGLEAIDFARMPVMLDNMIHEQKIAPVIAIFIPPVERYAEYLGGQKERFVNLLCTEIIPTIDGKYRTDRSPQSRAMMGISSGGHISLYAVLSRPEIFQNVGGQSSMISPSLVDITKNQSMRNRLLPTMKIYIDCGLFDIRQTNPKFGEIDILTLNRSYSSLLVSLRIPHYYKEVNDGHEWASWRERIPDMLIYFFGLRL